MVCYMYNRIKRFSFFRSYKNVYTTIYLTRNYLFQKDKSYEKNFSSILCFQNSKSFKKKFFFKFYNFFSICIDFFMIKIVNFLYENLAFCRRRTSNKLAYRRQNEKARKLEVGFATAVVIRKLDSCAQKARISNI